MILDIDIFNKKDALKKLKEHNLLSFQEKTVLIDKGEDQDINTPWFIRLFIGASAWISASLFLIFLFSVKAITEQGALPFGALFLIVAIVLSYYDHKSDFLSQLSLALNFSGHGCVIIGLVSHHLVLWENLCVFISLELVLFAFFKDAFQKFLSIISIPFLLAFLFKEWKIELFIHFLIFLQAAYIVLSFEKEEWILTKKKFFDFEISLQYAMILSLLGLLGFSFVMVNQFLAVPYWFISGFGLTLCMSYFGFSCLNLQVETYPSIAELLAGGIFTFVVGVISMFAPGIPAAILILLIAFSKKNTFLFGIGILFFIGFLFGYYYSLNLTLLVKSIVLMGSGIFLLLFRFILLRTIYLEDKSR